MKLQAEVYNFIKIEALAQVLSCEFLQNFFKNAFVYRSPLVAASALSLMICFCPRFVPLCSFRFSKRYSEGVRWINRVIIL